jgi:hypothetical protein
MTDRARRDRLRLARQFLDQHPDLDGWKARPLPARLRDLDRVKAWPLLTYAILTGQLVIDLDLLLVKDLGDFGHATERLNADDYLAGREIAARLGWSRRWTYDVLHENRGHFPNDEAVVKLLWLAIRDIEDKRARERVRQTGRPKNERSAPGKLVQGATVQGWNAAYGALSLAFPGRLDVTL